MKAIKYVVCFLFLSSTTALATEGDPITWGIVFPLQYLLIIFSLFVLKLGFIRKALITSMFIIIHFAIFEFAIGKLMNIVPELVLALSPSIFWLLLLLLAMALKKKQILDNLS